MSDTESFESIVNAAMEKVHGNYEIEAIEVAGILGTLSGAHDREIRDTAQQQYDRGFNAGQHSMDAEHRAVAMRLRALSLDGGSHENLSQIACAVYHSDFGWTKGACASLRDELVRLMGGVSDDICDSQCGGACAAGDGDCAGEQVEVTDERLADDCAADSRGGDGGGGVHMAGVSIITDELREWMSTVLTSDDYAWSIADRIDERARLGAIKADTYRFYANQMREERDELQSKLDAVTRYNGESKVERLIELILKDSQIEKLQAKLDAITEALHGEP